MEKTRILRKALEDSQSQSQGEDPQNIAAHPQDADNVKGLLSPKAPNEGGERFLQAIQPIVHGLGFTVVELQAVANKAGMHLQVVIHSPEGVSASGCASLHQLALPRIEAIEGRTDITMTVSSPGTNRVLKSLHEYPIFRGRRVRLLLTGDPGEERHGIIGDADDSSFVLVQGDADERIAYTRVKKARLIEE